VERVQSYPTRRRQHDKVLVALQSNPRLAERFFMALTEPALPQVRLEDIRSPIEGRADE
jgi:hypothetical protein